MAKQWHAMAENVLMAPERDRKPVADTATGHPPGVVDLQRRKRGVDEFPGNGAGNARRKAPVSR